MLYFGLLTAHSWIRWAVVGLAMAVVVLGLARWSRRDAAPSQVERLSVFYIIALDLQLLLGLALYFVAPTVQSFLAAPGAGMGDRVIRFWGVEHLFGMFVAVALSHIGRVKIRRAADVVAKHRAAAVWIGIALLIMLAAIPWPALPHGRPLFRL